MLYSIGLLLPSAFSLRVTEVHLRMSVSVQTKEHAHFVTDKKKFDVSLTGCFDNKFEVPFQLQINKATDDATGSVSVAGNAKETCSLDVKIKENLERRHPAVISMCGGGSCPGFGTCNSICSGGTCAELDGHDGIGLCNDNQRWAHTCTMNNGCRDCDGAIRINCVWVEYNATCTTECGKPEEKEVDLLYLILVPAIIIVCLVGLFFLVRYLRLPKKAGWRLLHSSSISSLGSTLSSLIPSFGKSRNLNLQKNPKNMDDKYSTRAPSPTSSPIAEHVPSERTLKLPIQNPRLLPRYDLNDTSPRAEPAHLSPKSMVHPQFVVDCSLLPKSPREAQSPAGKSRLPKSPREAQSPTGRSRLPKLPREAQSPTGRSRLPKLPREAQSPTDAFQLSKSPENGKHGSWNPKVTSKNVPTVSSRMDIVHE